VARAKLNDRKLAHYVVGLFVVRRANSENLPTSRAHTQIALRKFRYKQSIFPELKDEASGAYENRSRCRGSFFAWKLTQKQERIISFSLLASIGWGG
jgi:hypothetical protein